MATKEWMSCATCLPLPHPFYSPRYPHLSPQSLLRYIPPLPRMTHLSSTKALQPSVPLLSSTSTLIPYSLSYPRPLLMLEKNDPYSAGAAGARDISGGGGDRPWLACRPTSGPNDAGWGSAVRQATGWDCGNCWECGVCEYLPQLWKNMAESIQTLLKCSKMLLMFKTCLF